MHSNNTPTILGIGTDLIEIERIQKSHTRHGTNFIERVFTQVERDYCLSLRNPYPSLAARFAAKEAVSKALGVGIGAKLSWHSVAIHKGPQQEPIVILDALGQQALQSLGGRHILISLTHTHSLAQAFAIVA